ncbi:ABC-type polysaccharide transport system, permease component [Paenibacillus agaridevorans]|uniref:ABC-type polysaccharide transport system, permease component n=2 Tax=Paenibacillus agaridevorans TaxID=171404 RepID=A0A2R5ES45_9BACL|nr:ABC-type polysaccharide transport system, permease component [Paenibacillus agaridevorans]
MTLPGLVYLVLFAYVPMFGLVIAFKNYNYSTGLWNSPWVGFKNFDFLFASQDAWRITYNTLFLNFLFIFFGTIASIGFALLLNEIRIKVLSRFVQSTMLLPHLLSWVIVGYFVYALLTYNGLVNNILGYFGIEAIEWYNSPEYWPAILTITAIWKMLGYNSVIYLASILGISSDYYEAAVIDGAGKMQQIRYITLPLLSPIIIILVLLSIGKIFYADFGLFYNVTRDMGMLYSTTDVIDTYVFRMLRTVGDVGMSSAAGFYQSIVGLILIVTANFVVRKIDREQSLF